MSLFPKKKWSITLSVLLRDTWVSHSGFEPGLSHQRSHTGILSWCEWVEAGTNLHFLCILLNMSFWW